MNTHNTQIRIDPPSKEANEQENCPTSKSTKLLRPRSHSAKNISKAKIKTVKLTIVVIFAYIACSAPFICAQLWWQFGDPPKAVCKYISNFGSNLKPSAVGNLKLI